MIEAFDERTTRKDPAMRLNDDQTNLLHAVSNGQVIRGFTKDGKLDGVYANGRRVIGGTFSNLLYYGLIETDGHKVLLTEAGRSKVARLVRAANCAR